MTPVQSVLIIGASGRTGLAVAQRFASLNNKNNKNENIRPRIYGFCRNPSNIPTRYAPLFHSILQGDGGNSCDISQALNQSQADFVVVAVGDNMANSNVRTSNAQALVKALKHQDPRIENIRIVVVSHVGAGTSELKGALGMGQWVIGQPNYQHVLDDHSGQEVEFLDIMDRVTIVRPTSLTENSPTGYLTAFEDNEKIPARTTDRDDLAVWIVQQTLFSDNVGRAVNVASVKPYQKCKKLHATKRNRRNQILQVIS